MLLIPRNRVVRAALVRTFQKDIVVWIARDIQASGRHHKMTVVLDQLQQLQMNPLANLSSGRERTSEYSSRIGPDT